MFVLKWYCSSKRNLKVKQIYVCPIYLFDNITLLYICSLIKLTNSMGKGSDIVSPCMSTQNTLYDIHVCIHR